MTVEVTPPDGAAQFAVWKQWVERQIVALGRARRLPNASLRDGALDILADNGAVRARLGKQDDTRVAQAFYDASGNELIRLGQLPDGTYGLAAYDDGGNERVRFGQLPGGGYGALMNLQAANDPWTITRNVSGFGDGTAVLEFSGSLNPGPSVTISTGSRALVWTSVYIQCAAAGTMGHVSYRLSGATTSAPNDEVARYAILESTTAAGVRARVGSVHLQALTPGSNTFKLEYDSNGSTAVSFAYRTIAVLPI